MIKKKQIEPLLLNLLQINPETSQPVGGLLMERLSLGVKRRLNKIRDELIVHFEQLLKDAEEVRQTYEGDGKKIQLELEELYNEEITLKAELVLMAMFESVETEKMYDFNLLELIAK